jgi:hypothetical protein
LIQYSSRLIVPNQPDQPGNRRVREYRVQLEKLLDHFFNDNCKAGTGTGWLQFPVTQPATVSTRMAPPSAMARSTIYIAVATASHITGGNWLVATFLLVWTTVSRGHSASLLQCPTFDPVPHCQM